MVVVEIKPQVQTILSKTMVGETVNERIARLLLGELRRNLEECEREMLDLEVKYGLTHEQFRAQLEAGELGDPFSYPLEQDTMRWEDLLTEKQHWLELLRDARGLL